MNGVNRVKMYKKIKNGKNYNIKLLKEWYNGIKQYEKYGCVKKTSI